MILLKKLALGAVVVAALFTATPARAWSGHRDTTVVVETPRHHHHHYWHHDETIAVTGHRRHVIIAR